MIIIKGCQGAPTDRFSGGQGGVFLSWEEGVLWEYREVVSGGRAGLGGGVLGV